MVDIIGRKVGSSASEVVVERRGNIYTFPKKINALETSVNINPQNYALIQEGDKAVCAISITANHKGDNHINTIINVLKNGLTVPTPIIFMKHRKNVNDALNRRSVLYDASGNLIEGERLEEYAHTLNYGSWVWLNGRFVEGSGFKDLDLEVITGLDEEGTPLYKREPLKKCLGKKCYANVDSINSQGFLTEKDKTEECVPLTYFYYPRKNSAIEFHATPINVSFCCSMSPYDSHNWRGVFTCVEEAKKCQNK